MSLKCEQSKKILRSLLTDWKTWTPFCHGAPLESGKRIIRDSEIRPRQCTGDICRPGNYENDLESNKELVYLGTRGEKMCYDSALSKFLRWTERPEGGGFVFHIDEMDDENKLVPDEDLNKGQPILFSITETSRWENTIDSLDLFKNIVDEKNDYDKVKHVFEYGFAPTTFKEHNRAMFDVAKSCNLNDIKQFFNSLPDWTKSLISMQTVAYKGPLRIDREKIQRVIDNPARAWEELSRNIRMKYVD